jgi:tetratricopeptide (TPR) repeat protein
MDIEEADYLFEEALALDEEGKEDEALQKYLQAAALGYQNPSCYYNIGLIYKYRNLWEESFRYNKIAYEFDPEEEAYRWNYAIAATALRDWASARKAWADNGIKLEGDIGPIEMDFGDTPVRLNPNDEAEVVWTRRIDPVRAKITSIPMPETGYHYGDIVLHDGAATGGRVVDGIEYPVFNVLELFERSDFLTFVAEVEIKDQKMQEKLLEKLWQDNVVHEDWTESFRIICKACSEGIPHEHDDKGSIETVKAWNSLHEIAIATLNVDESEEKLLNAIKSVSAKLKELYQAE